MPRKPSANPKGLATWRAQHPKTAVVEGERLARKMKGMQKKQSRRGIASTSKAYWARLADHVEEVAGDEKRERAAAALTEETKPPLKPSRL